MERNSLATLFLKYIESHKEISAPMNGRTLVAVSGGMDSMVLLSLMVECGYRVGVAHCNFQLRGEASQGDQQLVERVAARYKIPIHTVSFDTKGEIERSGDSMQIVARRLRYDWFEELCDEHRYSAVATAHHADDSAETFFINLLRGTGLKGLTGIPSVNRRIIRPLLFASHQEVASYAQQQGVEYRDDASNSQPDYMRNKIRLEITPLLRQIEPDFTQTMSQNMERLEQAQQFIEDAIEQIRGRVESHGEGVVTIDISRLAEWESGNFALFHLLQPYGFNSATVESLGVALERGASGRSFHSQSHTAYVDRSRVLITERTEEHREQSEVFIEINNIVVLYDGVEFELEQMERTELKSLIQPSDTAILDQRLLKSPLKVRYWRAGDIFRPFGMDGSKRVSDYLIDEKVSIVDKQRQMVVVSGDQIVWLVGRRIDDRYKVTQGSEKVLKIQYKRSKS